MTGALDQLDRDLAAAFEKLLRSRIFQAEVIQWLDADSERDDRTRLLAERMRRAAREVFERPNDGVSENKTSKGPA